MPFSFRNIFNRTNNYNQSQVSSTSNVFGYGNNPYRSNNILQDFNNQNIFRNQELTSSNQFVNNQLQKQQQFNSPFISKSINPFSQQAQQSQQNQQNQQNSQHSRQPQMGFQGLFGQNQFTNSPPNRQKRQNLTQNNNRQSNLGKQNQGMSGLPSLMPNAIENPFSAKLPDGVTLQPIGEDILKSLQGISSPVPMGEQFQKKPTSPVPMGELFGSIPNTVSTVLPKNPGTLPQTPESPLQGPTSFPQTFGNFQQAPDFLSQSPKTFTQTSIEPSEIFQSLEINNISDDFGALIQNERNGSIFYKNLAGKSPFEYRNLFENMSIHSTGRQDSFNVLYKEQNGIDFTVQEAQIAQGCGFRRAVTLAIEEESNSIREIIKIYQKTSSPIHSKVLNTQIYEKIVDMNLLNMILTNITN